MRPVPSSLDSTAAFDEVHRRVTKNIAWTDRVEWNPSLPNDRVAVYRNVLYIVPANRVQSCLGGNVAIGSGHFVQPWKHWNLTWQLSGFGQDVLFCSVTSANNTLLGGCAWALLPSLALFHSTPSQQSTWWRSALLAALEQVRSQWAGQANVPASQNQLHCIKISLRSCRILTASRCNSRNELLQRQRHSLLSKCEQHILWLHITMNLSGILQRVKDRQLYTALYSNHSFWNAQPPHVIHMSVDRLKPSETLTIRCSCKLREWLTWSNMKQVPCRKPFPHHEAKCLPMLLGFPTFFHQSINTLQVWRLTLAAHTEYRYTLTQYICRNSSTQPKPQPRFENWLYLTISTCTYIINIIMYRYTNTYLHTIYVCHIDYRRYPTICFHACILQCLDLWR